MAKIEYNNLSEKFKKQIKWGAPLERDEVVQFQLIDIPLVKQNGELRPYYRNHRIPNIDSIYDPYKDGIGGMVEIAYVVGQTGNEASPYKLGEIEFKRDDKGVVTISGKDPAKFALLYYLRASNYNQSNPLAIKTSSGFIFKELEPVKTAKQKLKDRMELSNCMLYIDKMKDAELVSMLKALKQATYNSLEENKYALVEFIQDPANRERFNSMSVDVRMPIAALITKAEDLELIKFEKAPKTWIYKSTGKILTQVPPQSDNHDHLLEYFHNDKNGRAFKEFLEKEVESIDAEKSKAQAAKNLASTEKENKDNAGK
jgi:hypothetical protein